MRKIVTVCGSLRFIDTIREVAERLALENNWVVLTPTAHVIEGALTPQEKQHLGELHKVRIDLSDAIFVVNVGGYIGDAVRDEIAYAQKGRKEIFYMEAVQ